MKKKRKGAGGAGGMWMRLNEKISNRGQKEEISNTGQISDRYNGDFGHWSEGGGWICLDGQNEEELFAAKHHWRCMVDSILTLRLL